MDAASYADATLRMRSSAPGSARNTSENGKPGSATVVGVSEKTVQRRLNRARLLLAERLADLRPDAERDDASPLGAAPRLEE